MNSTTIPSGFSCPLAPNLFLERDSSFAPALSELTMSATLFLAFCILGCDFLLYVLFEWTYGERRRGLSGRSKAPKTAINQPDPRPFLVAARRSAVESSV